MSILKRQLSFTLGAERSQVFAALGVLVFTILIETIYLGADIFRGFSDFSDPVYGVIFGAYLLAALYVLFLFFLVTIPSRWPIKIVLLSIFAFATLAEYSYYKALGRWTSYHDIIAAMSATAENRSDSILAFIEPAAGLPVLALVIVCVFLSFGDRKQLNFAVSSVTVALIALFYVHLSYVNNLLFDRQFVSGSLSAFCQTTIDFAVHTPIAEFSPVARQPVDVPLFATDHRPANNVVFIFDESIRADHLSLNGYHRQTTPYLEELAKKKLLTNWGVGVSASTSSHPSYDAFIAGVTPDIAATSDFQEINSLPSIFQYAKAMNYRTHLFDGQMKTYWGGTPDDLNYIDHFVSLAEIDNPNRVEDYQLRGQKTTNDEGRDQMPQWAIDEKIARMVNQVFSNSTGNFIFLYKRGVHFPYEKNYPSDKAKWLPIHHFQGQYEIPPAEKREAIINSYDNSIAYNLDTFFRLLADDHSRLPNNTVIVYTSDHGENLSGNGRAGHGGETPAEANVPIFMIGLTGRNIDTAYRASHSNVFTSLLDLLNYPAENRTRPFARSLFDATKNESTPRSFTTLDGRKIAFE